MKLQRICKCGNPARLNGMLCTLCFQKTPRGRRETGLARGVREPEYAICPRCGKRVLASQPSHLYRTHGDKLYLCEPSVIPAR